MRLLSRNAEALFWLARYLERGASLARVIEMQSSFGGHDQETGWTWLLALHADEARFKERFEVSSANIISFYVTDLSNAGSVRSSIHWARENARALRPFIPLEMWVQLNAFYSATEKLSQDDISPAQLPRACSQIRAGCLAQIGIADGTLYRDEGYLFFKLGLLIERADQTSRLLDVKFAQSKSAPRMRDASDEFVFWSTILRTAAAYQAFRRREPEGGDGESVARFLVLNPQHPRSIGFCVREITESLQILRGSFHLSGANACLEDCEILMEGLQAAASDKGFANHLHEFNDWVQTSLVALSEELANAFFRAPADVAVPEQKADAGPAQSQSSPAATQTQRQS